MVLRNTPDSASPDRALGPRTGPRQPESKELAEVREKVRGQLQALREEIEKRQKASGETEEKSKVEEEVKKRHFEIISKLLTDTRIDGPAGDRLRKQITGFMGSFPEQFREAQDRLQELDAAMPQAEGTRTFAENMENMLANSLSGPALAPIARLLGLDSPEKIREFIKGIRDQITDFLSTFKGERPGLMQNFARAQGRNLQWARALDVHRNSRGITEASLRSESASPFASIPAATLERRLGISPDTRTRWNTAYTAWLRAHDAGATSVNPPKISDIITPEAAEVYTKTLTTATPTPTTPETPALGIDRIPPAGFLIETAEPVSFNVNGTRTSFRKLATGVTQLCVTATGRWITIETATNANPGEVRLMPPAPGGDMTAVKVQLNGVPATAHAIGAINTQILANATGPGPGRFGKLIIEAAGTIRFEMTPLTPEEVKIEEERKKKAAEETVKKEVVAAGPSILGSPTNYEVAPRTFQLRANANGSFTIGVVGGSPGVRWNLTSPLVNFTINQANINGRQISAEVTGSMFGFGATTENIMLSEAQLTDMLPRMVDPLSPSRIDLPRPAGSRRIALVRQTI